MPKTPMTKRGAELLRDELHRLKTIERPANSKAIGEARAHGDLSENAEYHAARERAGFIEGRISELEAKLANAQVIDPKLVEAEGRCVYSRSGGRGPDDPVGRQADPSQGRREEVRMTPAPQHLAVHPRQEARGELGRGRAVQRAVGPARHLVQRPDRQAAVGKAIVDLGHAEGQHRARGLTLDLEGADLAAKRVERGGGA